MSQYFFFSLKSRISKNCLIFFRRFRQLCVTWITLDRGEAIECKSWIELAILRHTFLLSNSSQLLLSQTHPGPLMFFVDTLLAWRDVSVVQVPATAMFACSPTLCEFVFVRIRRSMPENVRSLHKIVPFLGIRFIARKSESEHRDCENIVRELSCSSLERYL